tara:strand:- start:244 stop:819 length:576 start_codon:yes stop_codon:yes gene_type:complete
MHKESPALEYEQIVKNLKLNMTSIYEGFHSERHECIDLYGWSVPSQDALDTIASLNKGDVLVDYGCGSGIWSAALEDRGVEVWPYDPNPHLPSQYVEVESFCPWDDWKDKHVSMLLSWPLYNDPMGVDALKDWVLKTTPTYLFYVGESVGGCTGTTEMFDFIEQRFDPYMVVDIPTWPGIHDSLTIYKYTE